MEGGRDYYCGNSQHQSRHSHVSYLKVNNQDQNARCCGSKDVECVDSDAILIGNLGEAQVRDKVDDNGHIYAAQQTLEEGDCIEE